MIPCPQCNKQNPENFNYCLDCGAELHPETPHSAESQFLLDLSTDAEPNPATERFAQISGAGRNLDGLEAPLELSPDDLLDEFDDAPPPMPQPLAKRLDTPVEMEQPALPLSVLPEDPKPDLPDFEDGLLLDEVLVEDEPLPDIPADLPPEIPEEIPEEVSEELPEEVSEEVPAALLPEELPEEVRLPLPPLAENVDSAPAIPLPEIDPKDPLRPLSATDTPLIPIKNEAWMMEDANNGKKGAAKPDIVRQVEELEVDMTQIEERFCSACGAVLTQDARFCPRCGANSSEARSSLSGKTLFMSAASTAAAPEVPTVARLTLLEANGSEGRRYKLPADEQLIGREAADITLDDRSLSPLHAAFVWRDGTMWIEDRGSLNGVYLKVKGEVPLPSKSFVRVGQQLLHYVALNDFELDEDCVPKDDTHFMGSPVGSVWGKLLIITAQGRVRDALPLAKPQLLIGREQGELTFPQDGFISGSHAKLTQRDEQAYLTDLGSSNGTYLRVDKQALANNDLLLIGTKLMRFEYV